MRGEGVQGIARRRVRLESLVKPEAAGGLGDVALSLRLFYTLCLSGP